MIVDCGIYRSGQRVGSPSDIDAALDELRTREDTFCWIGLKEPSEEELNDAAQAFDLHPLAVEDAFKAHQRPKVEVYGKVIFVVLKTMTWPSATSALQLGEVNVFVGPRFVVTVRHGESLDLQAARHNLERRSNLLGHGPAAVLYAICDQVVDHYADVVDQLDAAVDDIEQSVFSSERTSDAEAIYRLKRHAVAFRKAVRPLGGELMPMAKGQVEEISDAKVAPFFRNVADHVLRLSEQVDALDDLLSSVLSAHLARVGVQQNDDMRRISAWVAMAAVPTLLAGIYGMNFHNMPELSWTWGYFGLLGIMAVFCLVLYRGFKRAGWL